MADYCILQLQGKHEIEMIEQELNRIRSTYDEAMWCLITVPVNDWDNEMPPWPMSSQDKALSSQDKLEQILQEIIPDFERR